MGVVFVRDRFLKSQNVLLRYVTASLLLAVDVQITVPLGGCSFCAADMCLVFTGTQKWCIAYNERCFFYTYWKSCWERLCLLVLSGFPVLFGLTGGYIWGFIPAVFVYSKCVSWVKNSFCNTVLGCFWDLYIGLSTIGQFCWIFGGLSLWRLPVFAARDVKNVIYGFLLLLYE